MNSTRFKDGDFQAASGDGADTGGVGVDAAKQLLNHLAELSTFASYYVSAQVDSAQLTMKNLVLYAALGVLGAVFGATAFGTAVVLAMLGIAQGLGLLMDENYWAGYLIVGSVTLLAMVAGIYIGFGRVQKASKQATVDKYEQRKREQREKYGHDVAQRAASQP